MGAIVGSLFLGLFLVFGAILFCIIVLVIVRRRHSPVARHSVTAATTVPTTTAAMIAPTQTSGAGPETVTKRPSQYAPPPYCAGKQAAQPGQANPAGQGYQPVATFPLHPPGDACPPPQPAASARPDTLPPPHRKMPVQPPSQTLLLSRHCTPADVWQ